MHHVQQNILWIYFNSKWLLLCSIIFVKYVFSQTPLLWMRMIRSLVDLSVLRMVFSTRFPWTVATTFAVALWSATAGLCLLLTVTSRKWNLFLFCFLACAYISGRLELFVTWGSCQNNYISVTIRFWIQLHKVL